MPKVVVGIATYKRPQMLRRLLLAIEKFQTNADVEVLVADNDAVGRQGIAVVKELRSSGYRFPIVEVLVQTQGLTYSRNAIVEVGFSDPAVEFVAMMDDDQWPEPHWLEALLKVQKETSADIVGAAVWPEFETAPPQWALKSRVYVLDTTTTGKVDILTGNGGVLIARSFIKLLPAPWYDHEFATTGGEDVDLFWRLRAAGGRFARAASAVIYETFPASRVTLRWALTRAYRAGNTDMRVAMRHRRYSRDLVKEGVKMIGAFVVAPTTLFLFFWSPGRRVDALCKLCRAAGKFAALQGSRYNEYATIHGR